MTNAESVILAIVEGLTEFIPVSSTGHMILTEAALKMQHSKFTDIYIVNIQFGAILSVVLLYWKRFFQTLDFYFKLFVAFLPAAVFGFLLDDFIDSLLSSVTTVAISLVVGGVIIILCDYLFKNQITDAETDEDKVTVRQTDEFGVEHKKEVLKDFKVTYVQALIIGCFQCIAMIPGVSRSAASIIGGLTQKLNIKRAAEFSFFLAVPTIFAASAYKLLKNYNDIKGTEIDYFIIGNIVSFVVGMIAIKFFIGLITRYGMKFFGYYRIILGAFILIMMAMGHKLEIPG
ncbi:MAG: undecaprenyl-diphosphate phosphatase [Chitinophagales bacterium]|nr:undecaprenyl-diphosphate phosphatase [Chitinophagales bacterium]